MTCPLCPPAPWPGPAAGAGRFDLGGLGLSLRCDDGGWRKLAGDRYGQFAVDEGPAGLEVAYEVAEAGSPVRGERFALQAHGEEQHAVARDHVVRVSADRGRAWVRGPRDTAPVDGLLRALVPELLRDGVVFHGCGLADGGRGYLCCGRPGSGKSTIGALFPGRRLSDELAAVCLEEGRPVLRALPFWRGRAGSAPLRAVHVIRHGRHHERRRLEPPDALRALRPHVSWPVRCEQAVGRTFAALAAIVSAVPVFDLAFAPREDVWGEIAGEA